MNYANMNNMIIVNSVNILNYEYDNNRSMG